VSAVRLIVRGVVQGVGMRPFVYRTAHRHGVTGWVLNSNLGVVIEAEGRDCCVDAFCESIPAEAPPLARIESVERVDIPERGLAGFGIRKSLEKDDGTTLICPDVAVCPECLAEFLDPGDRRHGYPFINCTNCGPRYSIIESTPYDRPKTSMREFVMCERCRREYEDPLDRRFHAQPNACPECGPSLSLVGPGRPGEAPSELVEGRSYAMMPADVARVSVDDPAAAARWLLERGGIVGVRGLGGYHIAVNALDGMSVRALREKKRRPAKPFALMCASVDVARALAEVSPEEEAVLTSPWSPVVLLRKRESPDLVVSGAVAPDNAYLGIMLPSTPLHHLLFDDELRCLVMTSANSAGEPIAASIDEARSRLAGITRTFLDHDREIRNRNDDSVVYVERGRVMMSRRSRGYAPYPIDVHADTVDVLACGTELKNTFAMLHDGAAYVGPHIGDMENDETLSFYKETIGKFLDWFGIAPVVVAHDLHPDYLATRFAKRYAGERGLPLVGVQHHHAHVASVAAENGRRGPVLGLSLDGTGYGTDGAIWGCEFLVCDLSRFERAGHLAYVALPGGDAATRHPYRVALAHLHAAGLPRFAERARELFHDVDPDELDLVIQQTEKGVNAIDTSSAGRLFDAVSALLGIRRDVTYEAQAAIELESAVDRSIDRTYPYEVRDEGALVVDPSPVVLAVLEDVTSGVDRSEIAATFHNTVAEFCRDIAGRLAERHDLGSVALCGGVFQNRLLLRRLVGLLESDGLEVLLPSEVPVNDGGVSLGQAVVANERCLRGEL